jgi:anti-sigma regulatory factor (Ser/Thr protein kinase)/putative methionine-R-sulfoxide reductase with GAF domain
MTTPASMRPDAPASRTDLGPDDASIDQLRRLQRVTDAALANLTVDDLMDELLERVREALSADTAAILLLDDTKTELVARAAKGLEEEVRQGVRIPLGRGFAGSIAARREPVAILEVDSTNVVNPILRQVGVRSLLGVPLVLQGEVVGVLHVGTLKRKRFSREDVMLLQLVADRVALAIHAGLYERERAVARTLQRTFLPQELPSVPGIGLAARYIPAKAGEVGGDWYDSFLLPDGTIAVAIGDVVGRGLAAASTMGQLRNALRAYALRSAPRDAIAHLTTYLRHLDPHEMATVIYGVIDPVACTFRFCNAGHVPPFLRDSNGDIEALDDLPQVPIGAAASVMFEEHVASFPAGSSLILYTDGLIERPGESLDVGMQRLRAASAADLPAEGLCDELVGLLLDDDEPNDDVAILVAQMAPATDHLHVSLPATASRLALLRRLMHRWLDQLELNEERVYDVVAAIGEAATNVVEHAYGPKGGAMDVTAERDGSDIVVRVRDDGRWRPARGVDRGRGTPIMRALCDEVRSSTLPTGTMVEMRWRGVGGGTGS